MVKQNHSYRKHTDVVLSATVMCCQWGFITRSCVRGGFQSGCERKGADCTVIPGNSTHRRNVAVPPLKLPLTKTCSKCLFRAARQLLELKHISKMCAVVGDALPEMTSLRGLPLYTWRFCFLQIIPRKWKLKFTSELKCYFWDLQNRHRGKE